jgi:hypothetical protein
MTHEVYMPFTQEQLMQHFAKAGKDVEVNAGPLQQLRYLKSGENYAASPESEA